MLCLGGCEFGIWPDSAQKSLIAANDAYKNENYNLTVEETSRAMKSGSASQKSYEAQYLRGMAMLKLDKTQQAEDDLLKVSKRAKNLDLQVRAADSLAEVYYQQNRLAPAENLLKEVVSSTMPEKQPSDHAQYRLGCIAQKQGRWQEADVHLQKVIFLFPNSNYAALARARVGSTFWSIQAGVFESRQQVDTAAKKYAKTKLKSYVQPVMMDGKLRFVLLFGKWKTWSDADRQLIDNKTIFPNAKVVPAK
jgi:tetratricopeptide (TPR) repeat protein